METAYATDDQQHADERGSVKAERLNNLRIKLCSYLRDAINARQTSGIEEIWLDDEDQFNGVDPLTPDGTHRETSKATPFAAVPGVPDARSRLLLNITKPKVKAMISRVRELVVPHDMAPYQIDPTPVPELSKAAGGLDDSPVTMADGVQMRRSEVAKAVLIQAKEKAERETKQIEDWFVEGSVYGELRKVIRHAGIAGTGVLKGPFPVERKDRRWSLANGVSTIEIKSRIAPTSKCVSYWDVFPDPSCGEDIHAGSFFAERDFMTARQLRALAGLREKDGRPSYDRAALAECLRKGPQRQARTDRYRRQKAGETNELDSEVFEVFYVYCDVPLIDLVLMNVVDGEYAKGKLGADISEVGDDELWLRAEPAMVTLCNEQVIRAELNPMETGDFPYDFFTIEPVDGQPWGRGFTRQMQAAQEMVKAGVRRLLENAGMSAGPQVVFAKGAVRPVNDRYEIVGRKLWEWDPEKHKHIDDVRKAFAVVAIPGMHEQLLTIIEFGLRMADELTNFPVLMQGQTTGSTPETLGGMHLQMGNATSPLRDLAKQHDDQIIGPHLRRYHDWLMADPSVPDDAKGDSQVHPLGATVLLQRDQAAMFLLQSAALLDREDMRIDPQKWFEQVARGQRFDPSLVQYSDDDWKAIQQRNAEQPMPADPRIAVAQINAQLKQMQMDLDKQEAAAERESRELIANLQFQIQAMEYAGQREISFEQLKAMLASKAIDARAKGEDRVSKERMFVAERQFAETTGEGRGL